MSADPADSTSDAELVDFLASRLATFERYAAGALVRWIEDAGLGFVELRVFLALTDGDELTGAELADAAGLPVETTYPAMHSLGARGWLTERDRRHGLSPLGREKAGELTQALRLAVGDFVASLPLVERRALAEALRVAEGGAEHDR